MIYCIKEDLDKAIYLNRNPNMYIIMKYSYEIDIVIDLINKKYNLGYDTRDIIDDKDHYYNMLRIPRNYNEYYIDNLCTYNFELTTIIME